MAATPNQILALDVGSKRIGVAIATTAARIARPLTTLDAEANVDKQLEQLIAAESVEALVVGLPRGLDGQETAQTASVRQFVTMLQHFGLPIHFQDEALTSRKAKAELEGRGKSYAKGDIDALAATYILDDFLIITQASAAVAVEASTAGAST
jgi:putative Holliday junction resolvase